MKNVLIFGSLFLLSCFVDAKPTKNLQAVVNKTIKLGSFNTTALSLEFQGHCNSEQVAGHAIKNKIQFTKKGSGTLFLDNSKCEISPRFNFLQIELSNAARGEVIITIADVEGRIGGIAVRNDRAPKSNFHKRFKANCQLEGESMSCDLENNGGQITYVLYKEALAE